MHRGEVGVKAQTYVLNVEYDHVDPVQLFRFRPLVGTVERNNFDSCLFVPVARYALTRIRLAAETVFGSENPADRHAAREQRID